MVKGSHSLLFICALHKTSWTWAFVCMFCVCIRCQPCACCVCFVFCQWLTCCWFVDLRPSNMQVYLRDGSAQII